MHLCGGMGAQGLLVHRSRLEVEVDEAAARRTAKLPSYMKPTASSATKARQMFAPAAGRETSVAPSRSMQVGTRLDPCFRSGLHSNHRG